jgi:ABC-type Fe3+-hydroxamate transport system substrate-binding protein
MTGVEDARGSKLQDFNSIPKRIVSLVPSQTELLYHLDLDAEVVGITKFCIHPEHWFRTKMRVGGTKNVALEKVKALQPDLILANKEENTKEQIEKLAAHFPVWVTDVSNLTAALEMIEVVGRLTGKEEKATFLKTHIAQEFDDLKSFKTNKALRTCYFIWKDPYLTVGGDTFIHDMLQYAGFDNIFAALSRYPEITLEAIRDADCELLLLSSEPYPFNDKHIALLQPQLPSTKILLVDGEFFSWYGSRLQWTPAYFKQLRTTLENG